MTKVFVVLERGYEYNDEGYDSTEGGNVIAALGTEKAALVQVRNLTVQKILGEPQFVAYALIHHDLDGFATRKGSNPFNGRDPDEMEQVMEAMTQEDAEDLAYFLGDQFFMVQPATLT